jgi:cytoskeletal protein CcmA (bactofilin family)
VKGEIQVARLVVGERATVEGVIRGGAIEVRGRVVGNIEAKAVKLYESAHVEGDIIHEQLSIDVGAFFQGRCQQFTRPAPQQSAKVVELEQVKA